MTSVLFSSTLRSGVGVSAPSSIAVLHLDCQEVTSELHWQLQVTAGDCFGRHPERRCFEKKPETTERARSDRDRDGSSRERLVAVASPTFRGATRPRPPLPPRAT